MHLAAVCLPSTMPGVLLSVDSSNGLLILFMQHFLETSTPVQTDCSPWSYRICVLYSLPSWQPLTELKMFCALLSNHTNEDRRFCRKRACLVRVIEVGTCYLFVAYFLVPYLHFQHLPQNHFKAVATPNCLKDASLFYSFPLLFFFFLLPPPSPTLSPPSSFPSHHFCLSSPFFQLLAITTIYEASIG